jgi:translation initiation factor IF-2
MAGDTLTVVENEGPPAKWPPIVRKGTAKRTTVAPSSLENMFSALKAKQVIEYPVVSRRTCRVVEAIVNALNRLDRRDQGARAAFGRGRHHRATSPGGGFGAPIIGFNVRPNAKAREIDRAQQGADEVFDVIYHLTDDIAKEMAGELGPERIETVVGRAEVKEVFPAGKKDKAAGLLVSRVSSARAQRPPHPQRRHRQQDDDRSLRRFKDDVAEVRAGLECGVVTQDTNDIKAGDTLEVFEVEMRERTL